MYLLWVLQFDGMFNELNNIPVVVELYQEASDHIHGLEVELHTDGCSQNIKL